MKRLHQGLQTKHMYNNAKKSLDSNIFVQRVFKFFQKVNSYWDVSNQLSPTNSRWAWITYYFTSNRICANQFGLNMVILPSHTTHVLQPLDVSCFNPFKKERDGTMVRNNYNKPNKVTLARWVDNLGYKDLVTKSKVYKFVHGTT